jgi:hypothetical protein
MELPRRPLVSVTADTDVMSYERRRSAIDDAVLFVEPLASHATSPLGAE